jgi:hypothetical protein
MKLIFDQKIHTKPDESIRNLQGDFNVPSFLDPVVLKQYITEYETKRKDKLSTPTGYLGNKFSSLLGGANSVDIENTCKGFKHSFVAERSAKDQIKTLLRLGRTSWSSQNLKFSNNLPYVVRAFAQLLIDLASDYSKNLSAIRNHMLQQILDESVLVDAKEQAYKTEVRKELDAQLNKLDENRATKQLALYQAQKAKKSVDDIKKCQAEYDDSMRDLAYLGNDFYVLTSARLNELFPGVEYPVEVNINALDAELNRDNQHKPNPHIPSILQLIYAEMYMRSDLSHRLGDDATVDGFIKLARKEYEAQIKAGNIDIDNAQNQQQSQSSPPIPPLGATLHTSSTPGSQSQQEVKQMQVGATTPSGVKTPQESTSAGHSLNAQFPSTSSQATTPIKTAPTHLKVDTSSPGIGPRRQIIETLQLPVIELNAASDDGLSDFEDADLNVEEQKAATPQQKSSTASLLASLANQPTTAPVSESMNQHTHSTTDSTATSSSAGTSQSTLKVTAAPLPSLADLKNKFGLSNKKAREKLDELKRQQQLEAQQPHDAPRSPVNAM